MAAILNLRTTTVFDFVMATKRPVFTRLLKLSFKHALKRLSYITFLSQRGINRNFRTKNFQLNQLRENFSLLLVLKTALATPTVTTARSHVTSSVLPFNRGANKCHQSLSFT